MASQTGWTTAELDPRKIKLDLLNPRVELSASATQAEIRLKLLMLEDVVELARGIAKNGGLLPGERVITVDEDGEQIVLEGNRRVAACQMLLKPALIPEVFAAKFPVANAPLKAALRSISVDVAPDRQAADPVLQKRHTEQAAKPWSPVAKMRRAVRMLERASIDEVAAALGTTAGVIRKLVKPYRLLQYALALDSWSADERVALENEKLVTTPYTRLFTLKDTLRILRLSFDADQNPVSELPPAVFREQMTAIARDFLLPDPVSGRAKHDTRMDPEAYFARFMKTPEGKAAIDAPFTPKGRTPSLPVSPPPISAPAPQPGVATTPAPSPTAGPARPKTPKASVFFENLECHVVDDNLLKLTNEIKTINHTKFPVAASLLLRALFECALVYKIRQAKKWQEVLMLAPANRPGWDPGLGDLIKFAKNFENGVFVERTICRALSSNHTDHAKNYLDAMTHIKYQGIDVSALEMYANHLRGTIKYIVEGN